MKDAGRADWDDEVPISDHDRLDVVSGAGCWIVDGEQRRLFDAGSGHSCVNLGYANEALIEAAARSYRRLAYCSPEHRCRPVLDLSARLSQLLGGGYRLRYAATGGGANELAIEIARRFWLHHGRPGKRLILALDRGYHGSTGSASFASGRASGCRRWSTIGRGPARGRGAQPGGRHGAGASRPCRMGSRPGSRWRGRTGSPLFWWSLVAFAGGVIVPPAGFLEMLAGLCRRHAILLIVDEVITGFGRSGRWFAFQHAEGVRPDIVTMGKAYTSAYFPLSAAAVSEPIHETFARPATP